MPIKLLRHSVARCVVLAAAVAGCSGGGRPPLSPAPITHLTEGVHFGSPATASVGLGVSRVFARQIGRWDCASHPQMIGCNPTAEDSIWAAGWHTDRDVFLMAEPGLRGGRLSLGSGIERLNASRFIAAGIRATTTRSGPTSESRVLPRLWPIFRSVCAPEYLFALPVQPAGPRRSSHSIIRSGTSDLAAWLRRSPLLCRRV
jgi:hypothetical protein